MWFFASVRAKERAGKEPLLSTALFRNRTSNLGLITQNTQWLLLMGVSFVVSAYLQVVRHYDAIQTGVIFTPGTAGLLASSLAAERLAKRYPQRTLILAGFLVTIAGVGVLLALVTGISSPAPWIFTPGLLLIGLGLGAIPARGPCPAGRRPAGAGEPAPATRDEPRAPLTLMLSVNVPLGHSLPH